jgi:hypothetical protein
MIQMWNMGHFKANCPKHNGSKKLKETVMTITEVMMIELTKNSWWKDSTTTRHITRKASRRTQFTWATILIVKSY